MHWKVLIVAIVAVLASMATACGGGQGGGEPQGGGGGGEKKEQPAARQAAKPKECKPQGEAKEAESATGVVSKVDAEGEKVWVKPQDADVMLFRFKTDRFKVKLNGEDASPEDIEKGQCATVVYNVLKVKEGNEVNRAASIRLSPRGGEATG